QDLWRGANLVDGAAIHGRSAVRAGAAESCAQSEPVGNGLAASEHQEAHAERRRPRRLDPAVHAGLSTAAQGARRQSASAVRIHGLTARARQLSAPFALSETRK